MLYYEKDTSPVKLDAKEQRPAGNVTDQQEVNSMSVFVI